MTDIRWSPERIRTAVAMRDSGATYADIATALDTTASAVAGILFRGQPPKPSNALRRLEKRLGWKRATQDGCRWIEGDPKGEWHWCGAQRYQHGLYCEAHQKRMRIKK